MHRKIKEVVTRNADRLTKLTQDLVRINSENHPPGGNEGEVQAYIADFWKAHKIEADAFSPNEVTGFISHPAYYDDGRHYENRPVVVAKVPGLGGGRSLLFCGHIDTVGLGKVEWKHDPYAATIENGRLYGRGAFDMKGGVAAMMMAAVLLREMGVTLKGDLLVETTSDEEFASSNGCVAARARGYSPDAAVITEPTGLALVVGHYGFRLSQVTIAGKTGIRVTDGEMANPVQHLAPILKAIEAFRAKRITVTAYDTVMITKLAANEFRLDELLTVPPECRIEVYWQLTPEDDIAEIDALFERCIAEACEDDAYLMRNAPEISYHLRPMPGSSVSPDAPIVRETASAIEATGATPKLIDGFAPNDSFVFNRYTDTPAIVFGPGGDDAHAPDEYVLVDDLATCVEVYMNLAVKWCGVE